MSFSPFILNFTIAIKYWLTKLGCLVVFVSYYLFAQLKSRDQKRIVVITAYLLFVLLYGVVIYYFERYRMLQFYKNLRFAEQLEEARRLQIQSLNEANKFKDLILSSVSHDLRTPLFTTKTQIGLVLQANELSAASAEHLQIALKNCDRLLYQVADILEYSNFIRFERIRVSAQPFLLSELLKDLLDIFEIQCRLKGLLLEVKANAALAGVALRTDQVRLMQVLINLLSNAIKFTNEGSISLTV